VPDPGCQYDQVIEINLNEVSGEVEFGGLLRVGLLFFGTRQDGRGASPISTSSKAVGPLFLGPKSGRSWGQTEGHDIQP
jgi:hypothetical protein